MIGPKWAHRSSPFYGGYTRTGKFGTRRTHGGDGKSYNFTKRYKAMGHHPFTTRTRHVRTWSAKTIPFTKKYSKVASAQSAWRQKYQANHGGWVA